ncbi:MAG: hypothetical protein AAF391_06405, partial [Bacteroidota bacterium]
MKHYVGPAFLKQLVRASSLFLCLTVFGQEIPIGTWRTHFSYLDARILVTTSDKIFCATENGLFSREISTGSTRKLSKIDGLSDVGVSAMAYSESDEILVIGYRSGLIDFVFADQIITISDIANSNLEVGKEINDITFGNGRTYLATDLGIIVVRSNEADIIENFIQIGLGGDQIETQEILLRNDSLFVLTNQGLQLGSLSQNLQDFNNWTHFAGTSTYSNLTLQDGEIYILDNDNLFQFSNETWEDTGVNLPSGASGLFSTQNLLTFFDGDIYSFNSTSFDLLMSTNASNINDIIAVNGEFYLADGNNGLLNQNGNSISPDGPLSDSYSNIRVISNEAYGFHAPSPFTYNGSIKEDQYSFFSNGSWTLERIENFQNVTDVAVFNGNRFFTSIGDGLFDETNNEVLSDVPQSSASLDTMFTSIAAGEQLWIAGLNNQDPVHYLDSEGSWRSYSAVEVFDNEIVSVDLSETGVAWLGASSGIITVVDADQNQFDQLSTSDGLPSSFTDVEISVEDDAWVATLRGPATFTDASFILSNSQGILPTFENSVLFEDEEVNAIVTDGGNRVWFGTNRGLWVFDENTSELVDLFTEANSPLPSDIIYQLAYNRRNGEIFIVTDKGMISYRSASSVGSNTHRNVSIFPNPVRPEYQGVVGITGLANNVSLKITDVNANLVKEVNAAGGSASWDLRDLRGGNVATGIYYFF